MVYNTQNRWILRTLSIVRNINKLKNTAFQRLDLVPSSGEERETPTLLGPLDLNSWPF
jgi:hypothetical protein